MGGDFSRTIEIKRLEECYEMGHVYKIFTLSGLTVLEYVHESVTSQTTVLIDLMQDNRYILIKSADLLCHIFCTACKRQLLATNQVNSSKNLFARGFSFNRKECKKQLYSSRLIIEQ